MKRILWASLLVLLLAACGTTKPDMPQATNTFNFTVDPAAQSVKLASAPGGAVTTQAENGSRVLVPGTDLSLENFTFAFLPGNIAAIDASFKNISGKTLENLTFSRAASSDNVVSSTEPTVADTSLEPGESTGTLHFTVQHRGQRFTYEIEADATVVEPGGAECNDPVNIPDDILRKNIRDALNKPEGDITCADMASLTELKVIGVDNTGELLDYAENFEGLQFATNLTSLYIGGAGFSTGVLNPLAKLEKLTKLRLFSGSSENPDLSVLSNLTNLTEFTLSTYPEGSDYNGPLKLDDLSALSSLTKLTELRFGDVAVMDISPLSNLTNLTVLDITNSYGLGLLSNLEPLAPLEKLKVLNLASNLVQDIEPLHGLLNLNQLDLNYNFVRDLTPLSGLPKLSQLKLSNNVVRDLTPLVSNEQLGNDDDAIYLYGNCLNETEEVKTRARSDVDTIENRNPAVDNVFVNFGSKDDDNYYCDPN